MHKSYSGSEIKLSSEVNGESKLVRRGSKEGNKVGDQVLRERRGEKGRGRERETLQN